jgi:hypothetical protein
MNLILFSKNRHAAARYLPAFFVAAAMALALSAVFAEEPAKKQTAIATPAALLATPTPGAPNFKCSWQPDPATRTVVKAAFEDALKWSSNQESWRRRLVASEASAKNAIRQILRDNNSNVVIPEDVVIAFYEYETGDPKTLPTPTPPPTNPQSQCMHIFFLPDFGPKETTEKDLYSTHLRCCYTPW